jgi:RimJ/RimL family protein N-acetyltransferase
MSVIIREAEEKDAARLIVFVKEFAEEPNIGIGLSSGDFKLTIEEEAKTIREFAESKNSIFLVAESEKQIIGMLSCKGGHRKTSQHSTTLGMSVAKAWRGQGVGTLLIRRAVEWAKQTDCIKRIELQVFTTNPGAIHLYAKCGFVIEGQRRQSIYRDGAYHDDFMMALLL